MYCPGLVFTPHLPELKYLMNDVVVNLRWLWDMLEICGGPLPGVCSPCYTRNVCLTCAPDQNFFFCWIARCFKVHASFILITTFKRIQVSGYRPRLSAEDPPMGFLHTLIFCVDPNLRLMVQGTIPSWGPSSGPPWTICESIILMLIFIVIYTGFNMRLNTAAKTTYGSSKIWLRCHSRQHAQSTWAKFCYTKLDPDPHNAFQGLMSSWSESYITKVTLLQLWIPWSRARYHPEDCPMRSLHCFRHIWIFFVL